MGKNYPILRKLSEVPELYSDVLRLVEKNLGYEADFHVHEDFAPLFDQSNWVNSYLLLDGEKPIAHLGLKIRKIRGMNIGMIGAVVVAEEYRGHGYSQKLMEEVISDHQSELVCFLLWSDQIELYKKFGFFLCGHQYQLVQSSKINSSYITTKYSLCSDSFKTQIRALYDNYWCKKFLSFERSPQDWELIEKITSSDLYLKIQDNKVESYFFKNKGQDLQNIIFEYGSVINDELFIPELSSYGTIWSADPISEEAQFQFMLAIGDQNLFKTFIETISSQKINIRMINRMKNEIFFDFDEQTYSLDLEEFLHGFIGPGTVEEFDTPKIFISGLDSI